ncbi:hypothetical protein [Devosia sp. SL43]|uniref:hypothetical protein n=1 Tax=Devosia sp. SL43 TaxID=2806348 RepID=UPI001F17C159|nr:hypothetical protein [Devosia sp. SL43]UJW86332.1 hypothetical protein IM737_03395 [Devosia sp. SL43]
MRTLTALLLLPLLAAPALAQSTSIELTDTVPGFAGLTYFDLARTIAPDLEQVDGHYEGVITTPVRNLAYADEAPIPALSVSFYRGNVVSFSSDGIEMLALMVSANAAETGTPGAAVLAIFDPAHPGSPIDIADVASDQFTGFDDPSTVSLGNEEDGLIVSSSHFNSSQGYRMSAVIALVDGKLTEMTEVFTLNENYCGIRREQLHSIAPLISDSDDRWHPFVVTVTEVTTVGVTDCDPMPVAMTGTRAVAATFSWSAESGRYEPDSTALDDLNAETEARF